MLFQEKNKKGKERKRRGKFTVGTAIRSKGLKEIFRAEIAPGLRP